MLDRRRERLARFRASQQRFRPDRRRFEALVAEALAALPPEFRQRLDNVAVVVEEWPTAEQLRRYGSDEHHSLFGLYEGTPLSERGSGYGLVVPDRIMIFRGPILAQCQSRAEVLQEIRDTVVHEIGHFFGLPEEELP